MLKATVDLKVYPQTRVNLRQLAALRERTMAETLDLLIARELRARIRVRTVAAVARAKQRIRADVEGFKRGKKTTRRT